MQYEPNTKPVDLMLANGEPLRFILKPINKSNSTQSNLFRLLGKCGMTEQEDSASMIRDNLKIVRPGCLT